MFNNNLPVSSLFCKIFAALSASQSSCTHPLHFLFFYLLYSMHHSSSMHHLSSVPPSCCTPPSSLHMHHSQQQQQPISSLFHILILTVHLVHALCLMVLHPLHVECSACSSWKLFSFSGGFPMRSTSLDVMLRFLSLSGSRDSSSSLA
jgi:hypothetical protein